MPVPLLLNGLVQFRGCKVVTPIEGHVDPLHLLPSPGPRHALHRDVSGTPHANKRVLGRVAHERLDRHLLHDGGLIEAGRGPVTQVFLEVDVGREASVRLLLPSRLRLLVRHNDFMEPLALARAGVAGGNGADGIAVIAGEGPAVHLEGKHRIAEAVHGLVNWDGAAVAHASLISIISYKLNVLGTFGWVLFSQCHGIYIHATVLQHIPHPHPSPLSA
mmetsp:Transcript_38999/g.72072  ORF Transcript_38999/g.72072 Transcript_38999/m.72072 type:complete len:218 (-) Transcript_38999:156-809(-)